MTEAKIYSGSCHCGKVSYQVDLDLSQALITCNCSMCSRTGSLMAFVPEERFRLLSGEDALTDYQFNTKNIHHVFCATCGVRSFARGKDRKGAPMYMVNARCLAGVEVKELKITEYDGRSA
ncbi:MAG: GFA family protein [Pseudomonadota bacterium]